MVQPGSDPQLSRILYTHSIINELFIISTFIKNHCLSFAKCNTNIIHKSQRELHSSFLSLSALFHAFSTRFPFPPILLLPMFFLLLFLLFRIFKYLDFLAFIPPSFFFFSFPIQSCVPFSSLVSFIFFMCHLFLFSPSFFPSFLTAHCLFF